MPFEIRLVADFAQLRAARGASIGREIAATTLGKVLAAAGADIVVSGFGYSRWNTVAEVDLDIAIEECLPLVGKLDDERWTGQINFFEQHLGATIDICADGALCHLEASSFGPWVPRERFVEIPTAEFRSMLRAFLADCAAGLLLVRPDFAPVERLADLIQSGMLSQDV